MIWRPAIIVALISLSLALVAQSQPSIDAIQALIRTHDYDQALALTKQALRTSPRDFRIWTLQGIALSLSGRTDEASRSFDTALSYSADYPAALRGEAQI